MVDSIGQRPAANPLEQRPATPQRADAAAIGGPVARQPIAAGAPATARETPAAAPQARQIVQSLAATPPVDSSRVESLGAAIRAGSYTLDPQRLADAMLASLKS